MIEVIIKNDEDGHSFIVPVELGDEFDYYLQDAESDDWKIFDQKFSIYKIEGECQLFITEEEMERIKNGD